MATAFSNQTEAAKAGLNLTLKPVERFVMEGLQARIYEVMELRTGWLTSDDKATVLQKMFGQENQGVHDASMRYPHGFLTLQSVRQLETIGNVHALSQRGLVAVYDGVDTRAMRVRLIPTEFSIKLEYVTNDYRNLLGFTTLLLMANRSGWLKFNVAYGRLTLAASVTMDPSISIPTKESAAGQLQEYTLDATITVQSYSSLPTLLEQQVVTQVDLTAAVQDVGGTNSETFWSWAPKANESLDSTASPSVVSRST